MYIPDKMSHDDLEMLQKEMALAGVEHKILSTVVYNSTTKAVEFRPFDVKDAVPEHLHPAVALVLKDAIRIYIASLGELTLVGQTRDTDEYKEQIRNYTLLKNLGEADSLTNQLLEKMKEDEVEDVPDG